MESVEGWSNAYDPTNKAKKAHGGTSLTRTYLAAACDAMLRHQDRHGANRAQTPMACGLRACARAQWEQDQREEGQPSRFPGVGRCIDWRTSQHPHTIIACIASESTVHRSRQKGPTSETDDEAESRERLLLLLLLHHLLLLPCSTKIDAASHSLDAPHHHTHATDSPPPLRTMQTLRLLCLALAAAAATGEFSLLADPDD